MSYSCNNHPFARRIVHDLIPLLRPGQERTRTRTPEWPRSLGNRRVMWMYHVQGAKRESWKSREKRNKPGRLPRPKNWPEPRNASWRRSWNDNRNAKRPRRRLASRRWKRFKSSKPRSRILTLNTTAIWMATDTFQPFLHWIPRSMDISMSDVNQSASPSRSMATSTSTGQMSGSVYRRTPLYQRNRTKRRARHFFRIQHHWMHHPNTLHQCRRHHHLEIARRRLSSVCYTSRLHY